MNTPAPRPLSPDAITDQFVDYVHEDYFWCTSDRVRLEKPALRHALLDAVKRIAEPPARPEGAEELETVIGLNAGKWTNGAEGVRALADLLASKGVRATEAE